MSFFIISMSWLDIKLEIKLKFLELKLFIKLEYDFLAFYEFISDHDFIFIFSL